MSGSCRICGSAAVHTVGAVEYLKDVRLPVIDCGACGCRFTAHDATVHDRFQREPSLSYYRDYHVLERQCRDLVASRDLPGLTRLLEQSPKYRFVIKVIATLPASASILEVGCSRGYLTAYSILAGRRIRGVDVSADAVQAARASFGDFFAVAGTPKATGAAPFDLIYHVGLIGCVSDPLAMTRSLLSMLKPGGKLIFNAPNKAALRFPNQLWFDSAPPPDLVTLFPPGFWQEQCANLADIEESIEMIHDRASFAIGAQRLMGVTWHAPAPQPTSVRGYAWTQPTNGWRRWLARAAAKAAAISGVTSLADPRPSEFGLFVSMRKRTS
jgi:SAM-dependent methyltransferase